MKTSIKYHVCSHCVIGNSRNGPLGRIVANLITFFYGNSHFDEENKTFKFKDMFRQLLCLTDDDTGVAETCLSI